VVVDVVVEVEVGAAVVIVGICVVCDGPAEVESLLFSSWCKETSVLADPNGATVNIATGGVGIGVGGAGVDGGAGGAGGAGVEDLLWGVRAECRWTRLDQSRGKAS